VNTVSKTNRKLTILTVVLMALSLWAYRESVNRADRFQRGQVFLSNLNPDEIARVEIRQADESVTLERQGETFRIVEEQGYPASNAAVNRLVGDLLELSLEKEVGTGTELAAELELEPVGPSTVEVLFQDAAQKEMVRMRLGLPFEGGPGRYVQVPPSAFPDQDSDTASHEYSEFSVRVRRGRTTYCGRSVRRSDLQIHA